jgi:signal transduction histidine kinase
VRKVLDLRPRGHGAVPMDLARAVSVAVDLCRWRAERAGTPLHVELPADLPPVSGDPGRYRAGGVESLINAVDASESTRRPVVITASVGDDEVTLSVEDRGVGMDASTLSRALDPFFTTKEPGKGTGLGLPARAHGVVVAASGRLSIRSTPVTARGSTWCSGERADVSGSGRLAVRTSRHDRRVGVLFVVGNRRLQSDGSGSCGDRRSAPARRRGDALASRARPRLLVTIMFAICS